jgi:hypothetical protein
MFFPKSVENIQDMGTLMGDTLRTSFPVRHVG